LRDLRAKSVDPNRPLRQTRGQRAHCDQRESRPAEKEKNARPSDPPGSPWGDPTAKLQAAICAFPRRPPKTWLGRRFLMMLDQRLAAFPKQAKAGKFVFLRTPHSSFGACLEGTWSAGGADATNDYHYVVSRAATDVKPRSKIHRAPMAKTDSRSRRA
jgi:hypothetical protein